MDETFDTGGEGWAGWFQGVASGVISQASAAQYVRPYDIAELEIKSLGERGYYTEGQAGTKRAAGAVGVGGISPAVLMLGAAALLAVFLLKD